jgi:hypothetical protein
MTFEEIYETAQIRESEPIATWALNQNENEDAIKATYAALKDIRLVQ